jgi:nucleotide-binding universal stress UspA family protein
MAPEFSRHPELAAPLVERLRADAKDYLEVYRGKVSAQGFDAETLLLEGYPADEICRLVERRKPDLLVLGSRGLSDQRIHLVGSVGYNVVHFATAPVLLVRADRPLRRVLVPVDGSELAVKASEWAAGIARAHRAAVTLLYVIPQRTEEVKFTVTRGVGEPFLGPLAEGLKERGVAVTKRVEYGQPAEWIVRLAEDEGYDLIILGERGRGTSALRALGGVTDKVLHHAPCSILVVR